MKFGLVPINVGAKSIDHIVGIAQLAESLGLESVWTFEHVMVPEDYASKYPYSPNGKIHERLARHGDGWFLPVDNPQGIAPLLEPLGPACEAVGRDPASIEISCMWNMQGGLDAIKAFEDAGVSRIIAPVFALGKDPVAGLNDLAENIIAKL
jgi:alkanesulfonate monooxygenase SsuD/methylene tetrahydromethanopterin reductase-like flavin-dependent oxidoreductase (luciferase family)